MSTCGIKKIAFGVIIFAILFFLVFLVQSNSKVEITSQEVKEDTLEYGVQKNRMLQDIEAQLSFGPRYSGTEGHTKVVEWIAQGFSSSTFVVENQTWEYVQDDGTELTFVNILSKFAPEKKARILLGAHFDSRAHADQDATSPREPVSGANDSASGVAVLREIARVLEEAEVKPNVGVDFVFFDAEEGDPQLPDAGKPWRPIGSEYFAEHVSNYYDENLPYAGVVLDMVCDADMQILIERYSYQNAKDATERIWSFGQAIYPEIFVPRVGESIFDDHRALTAVGIPSTLLIDFTYPYWHTTNDTLDKCSGDNLQKVTEVVLAYLYSF
jgi:hypothetical protein